jgi:ankyrin repeat protein
VRFIIYFLLPLILNASPLHQSIMEMDGVKLSQAIATTADINVVYKAKTALQLAVSKGQTESVYKLIEAGADVNLGEPTPMYIALTHDRADMAALLLDNGATLPKDLGLSGRGLVYDLLLKRLYNSTGFLLERGEEFPKTGKLNTFSLALSFAPVSLIESFIDHDVDLNYKDERLDRPMEIALRLQRHELIKLLIAKGVDIDDAHFLEIAVSHNDLEALKVLVKAGCSIDVKRQNLLTLAVKYGNIEILQELSRAGASLNYKANNKTALTEAVKHKKKDISLWLLENELDPEVHEQAIFSAISQGDLAMVALLIEKEIGLRAKTTQGLTPLLYAHKTKQFEIAKYLLGLEIDIEAKDRLGENALFKSIRFFQPEMLDTLITKGLDVNEKNRDGKSALNFTIATGNFVAFKKLLDAGAKPDKQSIRLSVSKGYERFYIALKETFYLGSIRDEKDNSLLHLAAKSDRQSMIKRLLLDGVDVNNQNERGETALHIAAKEGFKASCSLLLSFDANVSMLDDRDNLAMNTAFKFNHPKLGKWLENYKVKEDELARAKALLELQENNTTEAENVSEI